LSARWVQQEHSLLTVSAKGSPVRFEFLDDSFGVSLELAQRIVNWLSEL
jgi:hypothetical protein